MLSASQLVTTMKLSMRTVGGGTVTNAFCLQRWKAEFARLNADHSLEAKEKKARGERCSCSCCSSCCSCTCCC